MYISKYNNCNVVKINISIMMYINISLSNDVKIIISIIICSIFILFNQYLFVVPNLPWLAPTLLVQTLREWFTCVTKLTKVYTCGDIVDHECYWIVGTWFNTCGECGG